MARREGRSSVAGRSDALETLLAAARSRGWREALDRHCASSIQLHRYATDPREGDCLRLLPDLSPRRALFFGNALGVLPFLLAERYGTVVLVDSDEHRLTFARCRQQDKGATNVVCVLAEHLDDDAIPGGPFDLVALGDNCPEAATSNPLVDRQIASRLAALVGPGGCVMYAVRFPLLAPVSAALARPWTRSAPAFYPAHARTLEAVGFSTVNAYWRRPAARPYQIYLPLGSREIIDYWIRNRPRPRGIRARFTRVITRLSNDLGYFAYLVNNFLVIARRK